MRIYIYMHTNPHGTGMSRDSHVTHCASTHVHQFPSTSHFASARGAVFLVHSPATCTWGAIHCSVPQHSSLTLDPMYRTSPYQERSFACQPIKCLLSAHVTSIVPLVHPYHNREQVAPVTSLASLTQVGGRIESGCVAEIVI